MTDTTTIEITTEQKQALDDLKAHDKEAYKSVIGKLIAGYSTAKSDESKPERADEPQLEYDDVVQATRTALRDELPDQVFR